MIFAGNPLICMFFADFFFFSLDLYQENVKFWYFPTLRVVNLSYLA